MTMPLSVSRETEAALHRYVDLLVKWNKAINLVAKSTLTDIWTRHIEDSLQLTTELGTQPKLWVDLGSGGGLPGLVVAIVAQISSPETRFVLVESDLRKATFLREVSRQLSLRVTVLAERIESCPPQSADVLSARALAPLDQLCQYAQRHLRPDGIALFPKGDGAEAEIAAARQSWDFELDSLPSTTASSSRILKLRDIRHV